MPGSQSWGHYCPMLGTLTYTADHTCKECGRTRSMPESLATTQAKKELSTPLPTQGVEYVHYGDNFLINISWNGEPISRDALEKAHHFLNHIGEQK